MVLLHVRDALATRAFATQLAASFTINFVFNLVLPLLAKTHATPRVAFDAPLTLGSSMLLDILVSHFAVGAHLAAIAAGAPVDRDGGGRDADPRALGRAVARPQLIRGKLWPNLTSS